MKTRYIFLILSSVFLFTSCYYDDSPDEPKIITTKIHGHLMVLGTEEIINDKPYELKLKQVTMTGLGNILDEVYTDNNGYYEFEYKNSREVSPFWVFFDRNQIPDNTFTGGLALIVDTNDSTLIGAPPAIQGSNKGNGGIYAGYNSFVNVCLEKKAWLKLEVENVDGDFGDRIRIRYTSYRGDLVTWEYVFHHQQHFTVILPGVGNVDNYVDYWVTKNDSSIPLQRATVKLGEMDTTYYKLEY